MRPGGGLLLRALLALAAGAAAAAASPATARQEARILIDHATGAVLDARNADEPAYPASLTKMMTLYLTFRALEAGQLGLGSRLRVSARAASMPPTKLGLKPGASIRVEDAILGLVTRSANDAASVLAEALGGGEDRFALLMTKTARRLGMTRTVFRNASGLPDAEQRSTARDLARLATRLIVDYPRYYRYFSRRSFVYAGRTFPNHNRLMLSYAGMDGLKTGYTSASGFNLAASAARGGRRLVAVVLGGATAYARDLDMAALLDQGFAKLRREERRPAAPALVADAGPPAALDAGLALDAAKATLASFAEDGDAGGGPAQGGGAVVLASLGPDPAAAAADVRIPAPKAERPAPRATAAAASRAAQKLAAARMAARTPRPSRAAQAKPAVAAAAAAASRRTALPYGVQVGAFQRAAQARLAAKQAVARAPDLLRGTFVSVNSQVVRRKTVFRATLLGLAKDEADQACRKLKRRDQACLVVRAGPVTMAQR